MDGRRSIGIKRKIKRKQMNTNLQRRQNEGEEKTTMKILL